MKTDIRKYFATATGLTLAALLLSGCGTVVHCYTTYHVKKYKGDGQIRRYDYILIPILLEGYGYRGEFFGPDGLRPIAEFRPEVHQSSDGDRFWDRPGYCNNFLFVPADAPRG